MKRKLYIFTLVLSVLCILSYFVNSQYTKKAYTAGELKEIMAGEKEENEHARPGYAGDMMQWYMEQRAFPTGKIPENWRQIAMKHITEHNLRLDKSSSAFIWTQLGPRNIGGRIRSIAVDPANSKVIYIGSVSGGVWKTVNGGASWFPLKDHMENLSISSLVIDPNDNNIIYAGTGEGYLNLDALRGEGIFKSTDAGASWTSLTATQNPAFYYVNRLAIDKTTNALWAATRDGLYASTDGGKSFFSVFKGTSLQCTDVKVAYTDPTTIYASFGFTTDFQVYVSTDMGNNFKLSYSYPEGSMGRTELAVSISNPKVAYLSSMDLQTDKVGIMRVTQDAGASWNAISIAGGEDTYTLNQAWYANALAVDPEDENTIYAAGLDFYKSGDGGNTWQQKTEWYSPSNFAFMHADDHVITFDPNNPNVIYVGNDGGIYRSNDRGGTWVSLNNDLFITQFYYGAVDPKANIFYGGAQDNGTLKSVDGGTNWKEILSGDGGCVEVDYTNPNNIYMEYVRFAFFKTTDGGASFQKMMDGVPLKSNSLFDGTSDRCEFIAPFSIDPNNSNTIVAGTYRVFKTADGANNWKAVSGDLTGDGTGASGAKISALSIAKGNSNVIYAGCTNGIVQVTTDNGATWNLRNAGLPTAYLRRIAISQDDPATAVVVYSGFLAVNKVFKTSDYGRTWKNISGDLPNIPVNCILLNPGNPDNIVIGTDLGIFTTSNGGNKWIQDDSNLPNVAVDDLDYRTYDNKVFAATHGRGMFTSSWNVASGQNGNPDVIPASFDLSQNYPNPFNPRTSIKYQLPTSQNVSLRIYDLNGKMIKELVNDFEIAGNYEISWDGVNSDGVKSASGIYLYSIEAGSFRKSMKMVLLK